jgi:hypothetical protein
MAHLPNTALLTRIRLHREETAARHALARELADFSSPSDRLELQEILARHAADDRRLVENLLAAQDDEQIHQL